LPAGHESPKPFDDFTFGPAGLVNIEFRAAGGQIGDLFIKGPAGGGELFFKADQRGRSNLKPPQSPAKIFHTASKGILATDRLSRIEKPFDRVVLTDGCGLFYSCH